MRGIAPSVDTKSLEKFVGNTLVCTSCRRSFVFEKDDVSSVQVVQEAVGEPCIARRAETIRLKEELEEGIRDGMYRRRKETYEESVSALRVCRQYIRDLGGQVVFMDMFPVSFPARKDVVRHVIPCQNCKNAIVVKEEEVPEGPIATALMNHQEDMFCRQQYGMSLRDFLEQC